jgi:hypothetical protein
LCAGWVFDFVDKPPIPVFLKNFLEIREPLIPVLEENKSIKNLRFFHPLFSQKNWRLNAVI